MASDAEDLARELAAVLADARLQELAVHRFILDASDVRALLARLRRVEDDNTLLRQRLAIAWAEVNAP